MLGQAIMFLGDLWLWCSLPGLQRSEIFDRLNIILQCIKHQFRALLIDLSTDISNIPKKRKKKINERTQNRVNWPGNTEISYIFFDPG